jgi:hypothetical protein
MIETEPSVASCTMTYCVTAVTWIDTVVGERAATRIRQAIYPAMADSTMTWPSNYR